MVLDSILSPEVTSRGRMVVVYIAMRCPPHLGKLYLLDTNTSSHEYHILHVTDADTCWWPDKATANSDVQLFSKDVFFRFP